MDAVWRIELFGGLRVCNQDRVISRFESKRTSLLLAFLATYRKGTHSREALADMLWPEADTETGRIRLSQPIWALRRQLEPPGIVRGSVLAADRETVRLHEATVETDLGEFERTVRQGLEKSDEALLSRADEIYKGEFLPGFYEGWVEAERQRFAGLHLSVLRKLGEIHKANRQTTLAVEYARRLVAKDTLDEDAYIQLIELLLQDGDHEGAIRAFEQLDTMLRTELDATPSREALALRDACLTLKRNGGKPLVQGVVRPKFEAPSPGRNRPRVVLPFPVNKFFGREDDLKRLEASMQDNEVRLITLVGMGGCGKTRLSIEAARKMKDRFQAGIWFVPLADVAAAALIPSAIVKVLGVESQPNKEAFAQIIDFLHEAAEDGEALLVLDNFEHLADDGSLYVHSLLSKVPGLRCLITSRQKLSITGEVEHPLSPLEITALHTRTCTPEELTQIPCVQLFVDRAQAVQTHFQITERNANSIASVCERLEGVPLAIELAAAWAGVLSPAQMMEQLEHRFDFLTSRRKDLPARHQALRAVIDHSIELLSPALKRLFCSLAVFQGGFTLEAVASICDPADDLKSTIDALQSLLDRSLILSGSSEDGLRFRLLETLREYGLESLSKSDTAELQNRHAEYFMLRAESVVKGINLADHADRQLEVEADISNYRTALKWCLDSGIQEWALRLGIPLGRFWLARAHFAQGRDALEQVVRLGAESGSKTRLARCYNLLGELVRNQGDIEDSKGCYELSRKSFEEVGDQTGVAENLERLAFACYVDGNCAASSIFASECMELFRKIGDESGVAKAISVLASIATDAEEFEQAIAYREQELIFYRTHGEALNEARCLVNIAIVQISHQEIEKAIILCKEAVGIVRNLKAPYYVSGFLNVLGRCYTKVDDFQAAFAALGESANITLKTGVNSRTGEQLYMLAVLACKMEIFDQAAALAGAANALAEKNQAQLFHGLPDHEVLLESLDSHLGASVSVHFQQMGKQMGAIAAIRDFLDCTATLNLRSA